MPPSAAQTPGKNHRPRKKPRRSNPTSSPPSLSDGRLPQKAFQAQSLSRAKTPYPGFIMIEPKFLLEILIIPLNPPAQLGHVNQIDQGGGRRQGREPVLARLLVTLRPLDQQPLLRMRLRPPIIAMGRTHPHRGEAPAQVTPAARAPTHRLPGTRRQGESEILGADRLMLGIPALELGPAPLARLGRQGSRRPDAKRGLHAQDIA